MTDRGARPPRADAHEDPIARRRRLRGKDASPEEDSARRGSAAAVFAAVRVEPPTGGPPTGDAPAGGAPPARADEPAATPASPTPAGRAPANPTPASTPAGTAPANPTPAGTAPAGSTPGTVPETMAEAAARRRREEAEREAAERTRLDQERQERARARQAEREEIRRLQAEEAARAKQEKAERAAERKQQRQAEREAARARKQAPQTARSDDPPRAARTTPSPEEIAALASTLPAPPEATRPPATPATPAAPPAVPPATGRRRSSEPVLAPATPTTTSTPPPERPPGVSYRERYPGEPKSTVTVGRQELRPRSTARRVLTLLMLALLAATSWLGYVAVREPTSATVGLAASSGGILFVVWAVRASTAPVRVVLDHGVLEVRDRQGRHRIDLSTTHTPVEMTGEPGRRGWEVRFGRGAEPPLVLTAKAVDPRRFTELLRQWRPGL